MGDKVFRFAIVALALLLVVGVFTFAGPCMHDDGSVSACRQSQVGIAAAGGIALVAALVALFARAKVVQGAALVVAALCGVFAAFAPGSLLPLCMMATMRCHVLMRPFAQFMGIALAAVALIACVRAFRQRG